MCYIRLFTAICLTAVIFTACSNNNNNNNAATVTTVADKAPQKQLQPSSRPTDMPANIIIRSIATGDLNKDNIADSVIVTVDTADASWPVTIQVFLATKNGYQQVVSTSKAISPVKPGGFDYGNDFDTATIEAGVLTVSEQLLRGHNEYKYRYQDGYFELIGYTSGFADGGKIYTEDYNLMTGSLLYEEVEQETDETVKKSSLHVKITRPKLEDFEAGETEVKAGDIDIYL